MSSSTRPNPPRDTPAMLNQGSSKPLRVPSGKKSLRARFLRYITNTNYTLVPIPVQRSWVQIPQGLDFFFRPYFHTSSVAFITAKVANKARHHLIVDLETPEGLNCFCA